MIYVFEGPNGAGKTTLIDSLCQITDRHYYVHNGPSEVPWQDYTKQLIASVERRARGTTTFIDRWNMGEQVYPAITGRQPLINETDDDILVQMAAMLGVHWFVLLPPEYRIAANLEKKCEVADRDEISAEHEEFHWVANHHRRRWPNNVHVLTLDLKPDSVVNWFLHETRNVR